MDESLSDSLAITVAETGSIELPTEILEFSIDQVLDDGILKDIPFVGCIAKGVSVGRSISDRIFYHKVLRFLIALKEVDDADREATRSKIRDDAEYRRKVGEHLVVIVDKIDAFDKATILARVFDHFLTDDIDHDHFVVLAQVIERSLVADLKALGVPDNQRIQFSSTGLAAACGILELGIAEPEVGEDLPQLGNRMSRYGRDLRDIFLDRFRSRAEDERVRREEMRARFAKAPETNGG